MLHLEDIVLEDFDAIPAHSITLLEEWYNLINAVIPTKPFFKVGLINSPDIPVLAVMRDGLPTYLISPLVFTYALTLPDLLTIFTLVLEEHLSLLEGQDRLFWRQTLCLKFTDYMRTWKPRKNNRG